MRKKKGNSAKTTKMKGFSRTKRALPWFSGLGMIHDHPFNSGTEINNCRGEPLEGSEDWKSIKKYMIS